MTKTKPTHAPMIVRSAQDLAAHLGYLDKGILSLVNLYAAAPDLLLAAQLALEEIEYYEENSLAAQQLGPSPTIKRLRAAIAKAIGQEIK